MNDDLRLVYLWARGSRERLFSWLESLPPEQYTHERPDFAYGSLRNIQAHTAHCYLTWVGQRGLGQQISQVDPADIPDVTAMRARFREVDAVLSTAFGQFTTPDAAFEVDAGPHGLLKVTGRWLVMHPVTHEFHHKGQMLALGRVLGSPYPPGPDTDLLLPFDSQLPV